MDASDTPKVLFFNLPFNWRQGFPPNREIPDFLGALGHLHFTHSMQSSICIPRAEETLKPKNSNSIEHPNEV